MASSLNASTSGGGGVIVTSDATGNLDIQSGGSTVVAVTATGATVTGTLAATGAVTLTGSLNTPNTFGFKNRIINGGMVIDQRNAGASVTATLANNYALDRWQPVSSVTSKYTIQQNAGSVTPPVGFTNYLGITSSAATSLAAGDYYFIAQYIEGFNAADLGWGTASAKAVTLSFQVYSSLTGTFGGSLRNSASDRSYPFSYSIPVANTWTTISVTITGDTSGTWIGATNGIGVRVSFGLGLGSTYSSTAGAWAAGSYISATGATSVVGTSGATFYITGVQLEKGSTATSFDFRDYGRELAMCQRYFQTVANGPLGSGSTTQFTFGIVFPVQMRTAPSGAVTAPIRITDITTSAFTQSSGSITSNLVTPEGGSFQLPNFTGMTANRPALLAQSSSGTIQLSAEL